MDLIIVGHINIDHHARITKPPINGGTSMVSSVKTVVGGTATNIAVVSCRLGLKAGINCAVGYDFGEEEQKLLEYYGVDLTYIKKIQSLPTSTCWIFESDEGETYTFIYQGAMMKIKAFTPELNMINNSTIFHLSTADPLYMLSVKELAKEKGKFISFDPGPEIRNSYDSRIFREFLDGVRILFLNEVESKIAMQYLSIDNEERFSEFVEHTIITMGGRGVKYIGRNGTKQYSTNPIPIKNKGTTVGAGDAFRAGFWTSYIKNENIDEAIRVGQGVASIVIKEDGIINAKLSSERISRVLSGKVD